MVDFREDVSSSCCNAPVYENTDICSECQEHCELVSDFDSFLDQYQYDLYIEGQEERMKELNLRRLMDSCCVEIDDEYYDELFNFLIETDVDLNEINIDDLVVNSISYLAIDELHERRNEYTILAEDEKGGWIL